MCYIFSPEKRLVFLKMKLFFSLHQENTAVYNGLGHIKNKTIRYISGQDFLNCIIFAAYFKNHGKRKFSVGRRIQP